MGEIGSVSMVSLNILEIDKDISLVHVKNLVESSL